MAAIGGLGVLLTTSIQTPKLFGPTNSNGYLTDGQKGLLELFTYGVSKHLCNHTRHGDFLFNSSLIYKTIDRSVSDSDSLGLDDVYYLEPSRECLKIINHLEDTANVEEYINNAEPSLKFNNENNKSDIEEIIGKKYKSIVLYEIDDNSIDDDYTFPIFVVESKDGIKYSNCSMGMGEFALLYIIWFLDYCEKDSILLIEELENFVSAYSQYKLLDYLAYIISKKSIWVILSTHSEHVLSKLEIENTRILTSYGSGGVKISNAYHKECQGQPESVLIAAI